MASICLPDYIFTDPLFSSHDRFVWWVEMVHNAASEYSEVVINGKHVEVERGQYCTTLGELARLWHKEKSSVKHFLMLLQKEGYIKYDGYTDFVRIIICKYDDYAPFVYTDCVAKTGSVRKNVRTKSSKLATCGDDCMADCTEDGSKDHDCTEIVRTSTSLLAINDEVVYDDCTDAPKEKRKKKEKTPPAPPIKEKINKKENFSTEGVGEKSPTLQSRARKAFEDFYFSVYGSAYYYDGKDARHLKQLLNKIINARKSRDNPLPVDDDSVLEAFTLFLNSINKSWILNNFSISKINSNYNEIISEVRNNYKKQNRNGRTDLQRPSGLEEVCGDTPPKTNLRNQI